MEKKYYLKYLKYKQKYLNLKNLHGGVDCLDKTMLEAYTKMSTIIGYIQTNKEDIKTKLQDFNTKIKSTDSFFYSISNVPTNKEKIIEAIKNIKSIIESIFDDQFEITIPSIKLNICRTEKKQLKNIKDLHLLTLEIKQLLSKNERLQIATSSALTLYDTYKNAKPPYMYIDQLRSEVYSSYTRLKDNCKNIANKLIKYEKLINNI